VYTCHVTSDSIPALTLYHRPVHLKVKPKIVPSVPQNLAVTHGSKTVTLTWTENNDPYFLRYIIYQGTASCPTTKVDSLEGIDNTQIIFSGLDNRVTYFFRITALNTYLNESGYSNEVSAQPNTAPFITSSSTDTATEDILFQYTATVSDSDGDKINCSYLDLPSWLTANGASITGTPVENTADTILVIITTDGFLTDTQCLSIKVIPVNDAPIIQYPLPDLDAFVGNSFLFEVPDCTFLDIDRGDSLTYSSSLLSGSALPPWLIFNSSTKTFSGIPGSENEDTVGILITAVDKGGVSVSDTVILSVKGTTGILDKKNKFKILKKLVFYPNPVTDIYGDITLSFPARKCNKAWLTLYDAVGNEVFIKEIPSNAFGFTKKNYISSTFNIKELSRRKSGKAYLAVVRIVELDGSVKYYSGILGIKDTY
jgi:hypothetical protein